LIRLPEWTPPGVAREIGIIAAVPLTDEQAMVLIRLATDPRMERVWTELGRLRRRSSDYLHPARPPTHAPLRSPYDTQQSAMAETLHFAYRSTTDGRRVTTAEEVAKMQNGLLAKAAMLRELAAERPADGTPADMLEAGGLLRAAARLEEEAATARGPGDPLTVMRHTVDPRMRGAQIDIASFFEERFGNRLDATSGTLSAVPLGSPRPNRRLSQHAVGRSKRGS
jgi:hypothetical protein